MPWSYPDDVPKIAKNRPAREQRACVSAANETLERTGDEGEAIKACAGAMKKVRKSMAASKADISAQQARVKRYGIAVREDGNVTKPSKWKDLSDSQWGDPVNYLFPVPDKSHASNAKSRFAQFKDNYSLSSRRKVRGRLNRLLRKFDIDPIEDDKPDEDNDSFSGALVGTIQLSQDDDKSNVLIPAARVATFKHPWYGDVYMDEDLFESFVDNFQTNVIGRDLAIDAEHRRGPTGGMALAWINDLQLKDGVFNIKASSTATGDELLGREYRYASIEYALDYIDQETGINYGPTLVACAATNSPFVHRNQPIEQPALQFDLGSLVWDGGDIVTNTTGGTNTVVFVMNPVGKEENMPDEKTVEKTPAPVVPEPAPVTSLQLPDGTEITAEQVQQLMESNRHNQELLKAERIEKHISAAADRGVGPAVLDIARAILSHCQPFANKTIALSEEVSANFFEATVALLDEVPGKVGQETYEHVGEAPVETPQNRNPYAYAPDKTLEEWEEDARQKRQRRNGAQQPAPEL